MTSMASSSKAGQLQTKAEPEAALRGRPHHNSDIRELAPGGPDQPRAATQPAQSPRVPGPQPAGNTDGQSKTGARLTNFFNKTLVAAYKVVGFSLLTAILFGLFAYVALNSLFFMHERWVAPAIIAPSDLRVIELRARLAHELWNRQKVEAELARVGSDLKHAQRTVSMEEGYQSTFQTSVQKNATAQWGRLAGFASLQGELQSVRRELDEATAEFSRTQTESVKSAYQANLIDKHQKAAEDFQLAELSARRIQLQQQETQLSQQLSQLRQQARALGSVAKRPSDSTPGTFEGLQLKRSYLNSVLEKERATDDVAALQSAEAALSKALEGYDEVVSIISESPLLLAASGELTIAFVPYDNLDDIAAGDPVFGCRAQVVWCERVGVVAETIEGEVTAKHPVYGSDLRGKFVRLKLESPDSARNSVLHVGRPPLFF